MLLTVALCDLERAALQGFSFSECDRFPSLSLTDGSKMNAPRLTFLIICLACFGFFFEAPRCAWSLDPSQVLVVANKNAQQSTTLARYYMKKRNIPDENVVKLWVTDSERCTRAEYESRIEGPVRAFLKEKDPQGAIFRCLVTMRGVPLVVAAPELTKEEKAAVAELEKKKQDLRAESDKVKETDKEKYDALGKEIKQLQQSIAKASKSDQAASVDSELALVREESHPLSMWAPNPLFLGFGGRTMPNMPKSVMLVSRLDGPTDKIVRRIIDDSLAAEEKGLRGNAYFDARWSAPGEKKPTDGYGFYDASIHKAAEKVRESGKLETVLDDKETLFQPGQCPNAALYCGWYSLGHYVDAFTWVQGAIGYHIASVECASLRGASSPIWCVTMLEKGAAAVIGPVAEPYVQAFPVPEIFFSTLLGGKSTLAECYALSVPFWSWQMVLVGDPLYNPFKARL